MGEIAARNGYSLVNAPLCHQPVTETGTPLSIVAPSLAELERRRCALGISRRRLLEVAQVRKRFFHAVEHGTTPRPATLARLARALEELAIAAPRARPQS